MGSLLYLEGDLSFESLPLRTNDVYVRGETDHITDLDDEGREQVDDFVDHLVESVGQMELAVAEDDEGEFVLRNVWTFDGTTR